MNKKNLLGLLSVLVLVGAVLVSNGCSAPGGEGFAIYLTKNDVPPEQMEALSHVDIAEQPIISMSDVITYNAQTHEMKLTDVAFERIVKLDVPVRGKSFLVCVDKQPIYWGAFWTPISSMSFSGVTMWKPLSVDWPHIVTLELGYPSESFYGGEDPRNDPRVTGSLKKAGKLVDRLSINDVVQLPGSMKGYELYSWPENGKWHFTLITGTDRNKTLEEIISGEDFISEAGWLKVSFTGAEALDNVLCKVAPGSFVIWLGQLREPGQQAGSGLQLPPKEIVSAVTEQASGCGLDFSVMSS